MKKAPIPANEQERLQALLDYQILDTPTESDFDDITQIASEICQTPISLVSLIDGSRQWFKAHHGLDATETPRDVSFCGHAIMQPEVFVVEDSAQDPRFADNPLFTGEPHVQFYAGAPLITSSGHAVGTLCVIDSKPRKLTASQIKTLQALSRQVVGQFELRKVIRDLNENLYEMNSAKENLANEIKEKILNTFAKEMSHEINNPLAIIQSKSRKVQKLTSSGESNKEQVKKDLLIIEQTTTRIEKILLGLKGSLNINSVAEKELSAKALAIKKPS